MPRRPRRSSALDRRRHRHVEPPAEPEVEPDEPDKGPDAGVERRLALVRRASRGLGGI
jgi:hypothetical protein